MIDFKRMSDYNAFVRVYCHLYERIISTENLFVAWEEFRKGKQARMDVQQFERHLEQNLFQLHRELSSDTYKHQPYGAFTICDPKQRHIHKASVRDRIVHHAVFSVLNPIFEPTFIADSFSCRKGKGTHKAVDALEKMSRRESRNNSRTCFALQCDINKFFDSVSHPILKSQITKHIRDKDVLRLMDEIIDSFTVTQFGSASQSGIPIGNLTSQLFANVYLNALDQFMKHELKICHYVRYTDDFVIVSTDRMYLQSLINTIGSFLQQELSLDLHPRKVTIRKFTQGIDYLGYVLLPHHRMLRTRTKNRMFRKLHEKASMYKTGSETAESVEQSLHSYLGALSHANTYKLRSKLLNHYWFWMKE